MSSRVISAAAVSGQPVQRLSLIYASAYQGTNALGAGAYSATWDYGQGKWIDDVGKQELSVPLLAYGTSGTAGILSGHLSIFDGPNGTARTVSLSLTGQETSAGVLDLQVPTAPTRWVIDAQLNIHLENLRTLVQQGGQALTIVTAAKAIADTANATARGAVTQAQTAVSTAQGAVIQAETAITAAHAVLVGANSAVATLSSRITGAAQTAAAQSLTLVQNAVHLVQASAAAVASSSKYTVVDSVAAIPAITGLYLIVGSNSNAGQIYERLADTTQAPQRRSELEAASATGLGEISNAVNGNLALLQEAAARGIRRLAYGGSWVKVTDLPTGASPAGSVATADGGYMLREEPKITRNFLLDIYTEMGAAGNARYSGADAVVNALQDEANALGARGGGVLMLEYREYLISKQLKLPDRVVLELGRHTVLAGRNEIAAWAEGSLGYQCAVLAVTWGQGATTVANTGILLGLNCGVHGGVSYYPNQVDQNMQLNGVTQAAPVPYGWLFSNDWTLNQSTDNISIRDHVMINPYLGLNLDNAGRSTVSHLYGQGLFRHFRMDRCLDVSRVQHIHAWSFAANPGTALAAWIAANGVAFEIGRVDDGHFHDWFAYGYYHFALLQDNGYGTPWFTMTEPLADVCTVPLMINGMNDVQFIGGGLTCTQVNSACIRTTDGSVGKGRLRLSGTWVTGGAGLGAHIRSTDGIYDLDAHWGRSRGAGDGNEIRKALVINEGRGAEVRVHNLSPDDTRRVFGSSGTLVMGQPLPARDLDVSSAYGQKFSDLTQVDVSSSLPDGSITRTSGVISVKLDGDGASSMAADLTWHLPPQLANEGLPLLMELDFEGSGISSDNWKSSFFIRQGDQEMAPTSDRPLYQNTSLHLLLPVVTSYVDGDFRIVLHLERYGAVTGTLNVGNARLWQQSLDHTTDSQLTMLRRWWLDPTVGSASPRGYTHSVRGGRRQVLGSDRPYAGTWRVGERIINAHPERTVGSVERPETRLGWDCVAGGTPGTWWPQDVLTSGRRPFRVRPTVDIPAIAANSSVGFNVGVSGAQPLDEITMNIPGGLVPGLSLYAFCNGADTIGITATNSTGAAMDARSLEIRFLVTP